MDPSPLNSLDSNTQSTGNGVQKTTKYISFILLAIDMFVMTALAILIPVVLYYISSMDATRDKNGWQCTNPTTIISTTFNFENEHKNYCSVPLCVDPSHSGNIAGYAYCCDHSDIVRDIDGVVDHINYKKNTFWFYSFAFIPLGIYSAVFYLLLLYLLF
eukprot:119929_1